MSYRECAENYQEDIEVDLGGAPGDGYGDTRYAFLGGSGYDPETLGRRRGGSDYSVMTLRYSQEWRDA